MKPLLEARAKPQDVEFSRQSVPLALGRVMVWLLVRVVVLRVDVNPSLDPSRKAMDPIAEVVPMVADEKVGVAVIVMGLQLPPEPKVMVLPVLVRLPVPEGQVMVVLPWVEVLAVEP